jgi:hypothetical protein
MEPDSKQEISDAVERVKKATGLSDTLPILAWVGAVGPKTILEARLSDVGRDAPSVR